MDESLNDVLTYWPFVTTVLSAVGLATVCFLSWCVLKSLFNFFNTSRTLMLMTWLTILTVSGAAAIGYGAAEKNGAFHGGGIAALALGIGFIGLFWVRKWTKWVHNEKEEYS
jgi:hypothetical protein